MSHNYDHHNQKLFELLPSGKRYRSLQDKTQRMTNSYFPQAVRLLGESTTPKPTPHYNNIWRNPPPLNEPTTTHGGIHHPQTNPHYNTRRNPPPPNQPHTTTTGGIHQTPNQTPRLLQQNILIHISVICRAFLHYNYFYNLVYLILYCCC